MLGGKSAVARKIGQTSSGLAANSPTDAVAMLQKAVEDMSSNKAGGTCQENKLAALASAGTDSALHFIDD